MDFWYSWGSWNQSPLNSKGQMYMAGYMFKSSMLQIIQELRRNLSCHAKKYSGPLSFPGVQGRIDGIRWFLIYKVNNLKPLESVMIYILFEYHRRQKHRYMQSPGLPQIV